MNTTETIQQCQICLRYFIAGELVALSVGDQLAAMRAGKLESLADCGQGDCAGVRSARLARETDYLKRFKARGAAARQERQAAKRSCRSLRDSHHKKTEPVREIGWMPYADADLPDADLPDAEVPDAEVPAVAGAQPLTQAVGVVVEQALSQEQFVASGKADSANCKLREFFDHAIASGQVGNWFSRKFLKEICANDYINNRIDNLRPVYAARGLKIVNGEVSPDGIKPRTSHYRLLLMTDAEMEKFNQTGQPVIE